jgi:F-type H+-transporting ATPase subunit delta
MLNKSVGRRYAEAFFAIAQEQKKIDEFQQELGEVVDVIMSNEDLKAFNQAFLNSAKRYWHKLIGF